MDQVRIIFSRRHTLGSWLLRAFQWSRWSHCGIVDGRQGFDGRVIEAVFGKGVRITPLAEFLERADEWEAIDVPVADKSAVIWAAIGEMGKPYDWAGVLGIAFRRKWQDTDAWFCSELVAWAFKRGGVPLFRACAWRITPRDLNIRTY